MAQAGLAPTVQSMIQQHLLPTALMSEGFAVGVSPKQSRSPKPRHIRRRVSSATPAVAPAAAPTQGVSVVEADTVDSLTPSISDLFAKSQYEQPAQRRAELHIKQQDPAAPDSVDSPEDEVDQLAGLLTATNLSQASSKEREKKPSLANDESGGLFGRGEVAAASGTLGRHVTTATAGEGTLTDPAVLPTALMSEVFAVGVSQKQSRSPKLRHIRRRVSFAPPAAAPAPTAAPSGGFHIGMAKVMELFSHDLFDENSLPDLSNSEQVPPPHEANVNQKSEIDKIDSKPTSAVTILFSVHGRMRRAERLIQKRDLQAAIKHGTRVMSANPRGDWNWKYTFADVLYITDKSSRREITSWAVPGAGLDVDKVLVTPEMQKLHSQACDKIRCTPGSWTSHTVVVVDQSGSMRKTDVAGGCTRSDAVWLILALDFVNYSNERRHQSGDRSTTV